MSMERAACGLRALVWLVMCAGMMAFAQSAAAQGVPAQCTSTSGQVAKYSAGLAAGQQRAENFFASTEIAKSPKKLATKIARVLDKLHQHIRDVMDQEVGQGRRCRIQGVTDGFLSRIAQLLGQCVLDGGSWGQFAAALYCELSAELGGLGEPTPFMRVPVGVCGTLFQQVCDGVYGYVASEGGERLSTPVKNFLSSRGLQLSTYPGCAEFTEGDFESTFESARATDCAYGAK